MPDERPPVRTARFVAIALAVLGAIQVVAAVLLVTLSVTVTASGDTPAFRVSPIRCAIGDLMPGDCAYGSRVRLGASVIAAVSGAIFEAVAVVVALGATSGG